MIAAINDANRSPEEKQAEQAARDQAKQVEQAARDEAKAREAQAERAKQGVEALDMAYVMDVKPADAKFTNCRYGVVDARHVVRCGVSYGSLQLAHVGFWEVDAQGAAAVVYAMNGKALAALDRITRPGSHSSTAYPGAFKSGAGRRPLDIEKIRETIQ